MLRVPLTPYEFDHLRAISAHLGTTLSAYARFRLFGNLCLEHVTPESDPAAAALERRLLDKLAKDYAALREDLRGQDIARAVARRGTVA